MRVRIKRPIFIDTKLYRTGAYVDLKQRRAMDLILTGAATDFDVSKRDAEAGSNPARSTKNTQGETDGSIGTENKGEEPERQSEEG